MPEAWLKKFAFHEKNYFPFTKGCNKHLFNLQNYFLNYVTLKIKIDGEVRLDHRLVLFIKYNKMYKSIVTAPGDLVCRYCPRAQG